MCRYLRLFLVCAISIVVASTDAYAAITGSISGRVLDSSSAVVAGVKVTALNEETGISQTVTTDSEGFYISLLLVSVDTPLVSPAQDSKIIRRPGSK